MLTSRLRPFVCWQCVARGASNSLSPTGSSLRRPTVSKTLASCKNLSTSSSYKRNSLSSLFNELDSVKSKSESDDAHGRVDSLLEGEIPEWLPTRERLKAWDAANPQGQITSIHDILVPSKKQDTMNNAFQAKSSQHNEMDPDMEEDADQEQGRHPLGDDFQANSIFINPGDLIEARGGSRMAPLLAVFICQREGVYYFYCSDGSLYRRLRPKTNFVAPGFATEAEMAPIKDRLPPLGTPISGNLGGMKAADEAPSREHGEALLNKMAQFARDADLVLQENHHKLDEPYPILAQKDLAYITAHEAAEHLLSDKTRGPDGEFPAAAIYAVQRAIKSCEIGIRIFEGAIFDMKSCIFEILPPDEMKCIQAVEKMVRELYADPMALQDTAEGQKRLMKHKLGAFIVRARRQIDRYRTERQFKGEWPIIGLDQRQDQKKDLTAEPWLSPQDQQIMSFLHLWAAKQAFAIDARTNVFGSQILRAIGRYGETEFLGKAIGWQFLQEVGWILPWDVHTRHTRAVPGTKPDRAGGLVNDLASLAIEKSAHDPYPGSRKDWGDLTAFAIDDAKTEDIDDAVSVERTSTAGQYWIHVHVADVASIVRPNSAHAQYAEKLSETHYYPGHFARMLPDLGILQHLSLAPGSRALTFSGLVNEKGELLECKITPGILRKVVNIEPAEVAKVCPQTPQPETTNGSALTLCVGQRSGSFYTPTNKKIKSADDLDAHEVEDLKLLDRLATSYYLRRLENHASPDRTFKREYRVAPEIWPASTQFERASDGTFRSSGDIAINVGIQSDAAGQVSNLVTNSMILAGEIAGRWCEDRGIPVPYRTMPQATMNIDVLLPWVKNHFYPLLEANETPAPEHYALIKQLAGPALLSTNPGLHFWLGLKHYVKVTSPLRRYLDIVAHFQIHAALAEEARTGKTLQAPREGEEHSFLPFTRADLAAKLPLLAMRESRVRALSMGGPSGQKEYIYQALARAFYFNEAPLPSTFEFHIVESMSTRHLRGMLPGLWNLLADLPYGDLNGVVKSPLDLVKGDVLEVKLTRVAPLAMLLEVEAVRPVRVGGEDVVDEHGSSAAADGEAIADADAPAVSGQVSA
ncbi:mitochondrial protein cyt-4 [Pyricularia oryzae 70-15]|uniref:Mitochondrial protein cyt-4 n=3 Tax=Pyricularia oryzae TaxID=318829 RepID=G4MRS6_PYRO7|nr:mitochondrial protein cyt-4 [Pyricularia oryzae 70-15]EHA58291.1 mitochondrial protein cyt-4 [Pyricularia oryzae 70-15]ELQ32979.1 mitochondrial protein cyt-4 [Pyricularia oryzae Y34]KAI7927983.1 mitochondrial protein cyt-4 [Pyricularia oryzae]KAI7928551.1 mitochondrial protein cyt-4 [Pyricularia oryzae]